MASMFQGYQNPADAAAEMDIAQRMQQAALLRQRAVTMPGEVGGVAVVPNAVGLGARVISALMGRRQQQQALDQAQQYGDQRRQRLMQAVQASGMAKTPDEMQAAGVAMMGEDPAAGMRLIQSAARMRAEAAQQEAQANREMKRYEHMDARQQAMFTHQEEMRKEAERAADERQQAQLAAIAERMSQSGGVNPYATLAQGVDPITGKPIFLAFDTRTKQMTRVEIPGGNVTPSAQSAEVQRDIAAGKAAGKVEGTAIAEATASEPMRNAAAQSTKATLDQLKNHPGFNAIFGSIAGLAPNLRKESVNAAALRDQVVAMLALENRSKLKGSGAVSDFETRLLNQASTTLSNPRISPEAAAVEIEKVGRLLDLWQQGASDEAIRAAFGEAPMPAAPSATPPAAAVPAGGGQMLNFDAQGNLVP